MKDENIKKVLLLGSGTQHLDIIFLQDALAIEFHTTVEGSLTTEAEEDTLRREAG